MKYCLSLFAFALLIISCTDQPITTHYENGQVYEVYQYKGDSLKHGTYERFSESGILLEKSIYKDGYVDGLRSIYNTDGNLEITETYADKKLNGTYSTYYPDGTLQLSAEYANDVMQGIVKGYYASGAIKEEVTFVDSQEEGPFKEYHENGNLMWKGTYNGGDKEFGLLEKFDEEGTLVRKMMCDDRGVCNTTWSIEKEEGELN